MSVDKLIFMFAKFSQVQLYLNQVAYRFHWCNTCAFDGIIGLLSGNLDGGVKNVVWERLKNA